jgi:MFS family permease
MTLRTSNSAVLRLAASQGLAYAGRGAAMTALIWELYQTSHSSWLVSAAMLGVFGVSTAVSPWAGHVGDRHDRRAVVVISALLAAFGFLGCAVLADLHLTVALVAAMIAAASTQGALSAAVTGAVPNLVSEEELTGANSMTGAFKSAGFMLGPGIGGALLAVISAPGVFAFGGILLLISAGLVVGLRGNVSENRHAAHAIGGRLDGYKHLWEDRWLRLLTIAWALVMFGIGPVIVAEVVLAHHFHVGSTGYGLIAVFWDGGGVVGALAGRKLPRRLEHAAVAGGCLAIGLGFSVVGLTPVFWPVLLGMLIAGLFDAFGVVAAQNLIARRTPDRIRSRVSAALDAVVLGAMAASFGLSAPLVELLGPQGVYLAAAVLCAVATALLVPTLGGIPTLPGQTTVTRGARSVGRGARTVGRGVRSLGRPQRLPRAGRRVVRRQRTPR